MSGVPSTRSGVGKKPSQAGGGGGAGGAAGGGEGVGLRANAGEGGDDNKEESPSPVPTSTSDAEAASQAQLLILQKRISEMEAVAASKDTAMAAQTSLLAAQASLIAATRAHIVEAKEIEAMKLQEQALEALVAAEIGELEIGKAVDSLEKAAQEERARPGEPCSEMELQIRLADMVEERHRRERAEVAANVSKIAVSQRSLLKPSPQVLSPPVMQRGGRVGSSKVGASSSEWTTSVLKAIVPIELRATEAAKGTVLEDWIFGVERVIKCAGVEDFVERMEMVGMFWDRPVNTWWLGAQEAAVRRGNPITDWERFLTVLRANYTPISDVDTACDTLFGLVQGSRESMDQYVGRAHELFNRIPRTRVPSEVAAEFLQRGVDGRRFILTLVAVKGQQQKERLHGKGMSFEMMRSMLVEEAVREPQHSMGGGHAAASSSSAGSQAHRSSYGSKQRVNNIDTRASGHYPQPEGEEEEEEEGEEQQRINALDVAEVKCYRCQQRGHFAKECSRPDTRTCGKCKKKGHLAKNCRTQAPGGARPESKSTN